MLDGMISNGDPKIVLICKRICVSEADFAARIYRMSAKLNFPETAHGLPEKPRPRGAVVDGVIGRKKCWELIEEGDRSVIASLHTITICISIYAGFWMQFLLQLIHDQPSLYVLSGRAWIIPDVHYFLPLTEEIPWSMAECFFCLTLFGVLMAFIYGWHFTSGVKGKWRMRGLVLVFGALTTGWSGAALFAQGDSWRGLEAWRIYLIEDGYREGGFENPYQQQIDRIEDLLLKRPK